MNCRIDRSEWKWKIFDVETCVYQHYIPKKGFIYLNGSIAKMKSKEIAREMSVVAQENQQDFDFSVREMLLMGRYAHKKRVEEHSSDDE